MKELLGFTVQRFKISGVFGIHIVQGQVTRQETPFTTVLGTIEGVQRWLDENQAFVSVKVTDLKTKEDITSQFNIVYSRSRYNQPLRVSEYQ
jgi:hypothetical protein